MFANTLLYFSRIQKEISVPAPSSEMQSVGGNFCVSFLLTDAWYEGKFPFAFLHDCKMWLNISVSILLNDGDYRFLTDAKCGREFPPAFSSQKQNTVKPVYNGLVYSSHAIYYQSLGNFPKFSVALYFLQSWSVYSGHPVYNGAETNCGIALNNQPYFISSLLYTLTDTSSTGKR